MEMNNLIAREEHEEFKGRLEEEDRRLSKRISVLEETVPKLQALAVSIERLAANMENMTMELSRQGERLEKLEGRDGEMWRKIVGCAATTIVGAVIGFIFARIGMG